MTGTFSALDGQRFDAVIIGGGINGASAARELAAAGYSCLLAEQEDFGSGASGRSSRMLHCGLRYFETPSPLTDFGLHPRRFAQALVMAREAMRCRAELVRDSSPRLKPFTMHFPVWRGGQVAGWHLEAGLRLLAALGPRDVPLNHARLRGERLAELPFLGDLREPERLTSVARYTEYVFDWPERLCIDAVLEAGRRGAMVLNRCRAELGSRDGDGAWRVRLAGQATVRAPVVLVMAGTWIDDVVGRDGQPLVRGTKGAHIVVPMPPTYRGAGIAAMHRGGHPFYMIPVDGDLFCFGPTETPFDGDAAGVHATDEDIDFLIGEANHLLPGRGLMRSDVELTCAGVRPLTFHPDLPMGNRARELHDLAPRGLDGVLALTAGPVMTHRSAGRLALEAVAQRLPGRERRGGPGYAAHEFRGASPGPIGARPEVTAADIAAAARDEQPHSLADLLIRRVGLAGRRQLSEAEVTSAATAAAAAMGWPEPRRNEEIQKFLALQAQLFRKPGPAQAD